MRFQDLFLSYFIIFIVFTLIFIDLKKLANEKGEDYVYQTRSTICSEK